MNLGIEENSNEFYNKNQTFPKQQLPRIETLTINQLPKFTTAFTKHKILCQAFLLEQ